MDKGKKSNALNIPINEQIIHDSVIPDRAEELIIANRKLAFQIADKEKMAVELSIANEELIFQNEEKEKRAAELIIANQELIYQNQEKAKRAAELSIANEELIFQNEEKEKRAAELIIANQELIFQNQEKAKRADELIIANNELLIQNREREERAFELFNTNQDIKKAEEQLIEANNELESFSYTVSHDLRAPLRAIHGYSKMLHENYGTQLDEEAHRLMNTIINNAKKMGRLIDELLNFSRIGRKELVKTNIEMHEFVTSVCNDYRTEQSGNDITFHIKELIPALADGNAIKQVWINLISNAVKYSSLKKKPVIEIGSFIEEDEVVYYINDNGAGFDMRYADKLFGVFQRLHSDREFEGTGVGLALVQRIIFKHGGRVWGKGKVQEGATFYFTLNKAQQHDNGN